jgi:hypothetical protein
MHQKKASWKNREPRHRFVPAVPVFHIEWSLNVGDGVLIALIGIPTSPSLNTKGHQTV